LSAPAERRLVSLAVALLAAGAGALLLVASVKLQTRWFERHVLPNYCVSSLADERVVSLGRASLAIVGGLLVVVVAPLGARFFLLRSLRAAASTLLGAALALVLAALVSEGALELRARRAASAMPGPEVPKTRGDARLGWTFLPHQRHARAMATASTSSTATAIARARSTRPSIPSGRR
jgi:hypothetical protein